VCGMTVDPATAAAHLTYAGQDYAFCSDGCARTFAADPLAHLAEVRDPVCGMTVDTAHPGAEATVDGRRYAFCGAACAAAFTADPGQYLPEVAGTVRTT